MPGGQPAVSALITCEHASNAVPRRWRPLFAGHGDLLDSHRGWDPGAQALARDLARALGAPLLEGRVSRLLIDLNRSARHPGLYSPYTRRLPAPQREELKRRYWTPHWSRFRELLESLTGPIIHIACHSYTPKLDGRLRNADFGLLYDPGRAREKAWCRLLAANLKQQLPAMKIRMNYPYRGTSNGIGQQHRRLFSDERLISMEIEINQRWVGTSRWPDIRARVVTACRATCHSKGRLGDTAPENVIFL